MICKNLIEKLPIILQNAIILNLILINKITLEGKILLYQKYFSVSLLSVEQYGILLHIQTIIFPLL